jgi:hypothetical protein
LSVARYFAERLSFIGSKSGCSIDVVESTEFIVGFDFGIVVIFTGVIDVFIFVGVNVIVVIVIVVVTW